MRSGFPKPDRADFAEYAAALPERDERRRIAEILDTLDEAIRKTEHIIAKLEQVKQLAQPPGNAAEARALTP